MSTTSAQERSPSRPTTAVSILRLLRSSGVQTAFGLPGVHNLAFWAHTGEDVPAIVGVRHEQTTVYAADGLARATGGLGVALTTTGPGAANAVAAFGEASASGSPVLLVASEISTALARPGRLRGVLHECRNQAGMFEPLAKAVFTPRTPADVLRCMPSAISQAMACPRGPVYIDVPSDVLGAEAADMKVSAQSHSEETKPVTDLPPGPDLAKLRDIVVRSERIVLWLGGGVVQAGAPKVAARLAERLQAPTVTTYTARGVLSPDHPNLVRYPPHEPEVAELIEKADLLLAIGTNFDGMMTRNWSMPLAKTLALVNCNEDDLAKNYSAEVTVQADAGVAMSYLLDQVPGRPMSTDAVRTNQAVCERLRSESDASEPLRLVASVSAAVQDDVAVIVDMAVAGYWYGGYGRVARPRQLQYPVGWGTLGYALPAAIGSASAGITTLAICGDGGIMFALGELATVAEHRLPLTILVVDDGGYGMLRYDQKRAGEPSVGVDLAAPDWISLGRSFGLVTREAQDLGDSLRAALDTSIASRSPGLVITRASLNPPRTTSPRWHE